MKLEPRHASAGGLWLAALFAAGLAGLSVVPQALPSGVLASHVAVFELQSTRLQFVLYAGLLLLLAARCLELLVRVEPFAGTSPRSSKVLAGVAVVTLLGAGVHQPRSELAALAGALVVSALTWRWWPRRLPVSAGWVWPVVLLGSSVVGLLFFPPIIADEAHLVTVESHYAMSVLPGLDWVSHGVAARSNYGAGMTLLVALGLRVFDPTQVGALFAVVKTYQLLATLTVLGLALTLARGSRPLVATLVLCTLARFHPGETGLSFPNLSGVRFLPALVALWLLMLEARRPSPRAWWVGLVCGVLGGLTPDLGLAVWAGGVVLAVLRGFDPARRVSSLGRALVQVGLGSVGGFALAAAGVVGLGVGSTGSLLALFVGGYGGWGEWPSVMGTLLVFLATTLLLRAVAATRAGHLSSARAQQATLATAALLWLPYYVNRMHEVNLWFAEVLLVLALVPDLRARRLALRPRWPSWGAAWLGVARLAVALLLAQSVVRFVDVGSRWASTIEARCARLAPTSGYCLAFEGKLALVPKVRALRAAREGDVVVLTVLPALTRTLGLNANFPWEDAFGEVSSTAEWERAVAWLSHARPRQLWLDAPDATLTLRAKDRAQHLAALAAAVPGYHPVPSPEGWRVLQRDD